MIDKEQEGYLTGTEALGCIEQAYLKVTEATAESTDAPQSEGSDGDLLPERGGDLSFRP